MKNEKRLVICHVLLSRGFAGSERSTAESCNQQVQDHDVYLIVKKSHRKLGKSVSDHIDSRVKLIEVPDLFFTQKMLQEKINVINPDVIHCHLRRATRLVSKLKTAAATVSTLHIGVNSQHFYRLDGIICNARWQVKSIADSYQGLVHKANNSLTPHRRLSSDEKIALRKSFGFDEQDLLIGAVGRFSASKAWDTLIQAYQDVANKKQSKLVFFGNGSLEKSLKSSAKTESKIIFYAFQDNIKDIYQALDLLICPSRFEPLPRVMLEGYDAGVPIIASDAGGCGELVEDYGGQSFAVDNVLALSELIQAFIDKPFTPHRPDLSAHYIENTNRAMLDFYNDCIAAKLK